MPTTGDHSKDQRRISSAFLLTGLVLLIAALLMAVYVIVMTYWPATQGVEFEGRIDNPPASAVGNPSRNERQPANNVNQNRQHHHSSSRQTKIFHHHRQQTNQLSSPSPSPTPTSVSSPCIVPATKATIQKRPGFFKRAWNFIKRIFGGGRPKSVPNSAPTVCACNASSSLITLPCPPGFDNPACPPSASRSVELTAEAVDSDKDTLLYTWSVTRGTITGEGRTVNWDLSGVNTGAYTATVEVNDGNNHTANATTTVTVAQCSHCAPPCPTVSVSCPSQVEPGAPITFTTSITGDASLTYNWSVSAGTIISGQGTSSIEVDTTGLAGQTVTATVELGGLDPSCSRTASCSTSVAPPAAMLRKFDEYGDINFDDERAHLDNFAIHLQNSPVTEGHIMVYDKCAGDAQARANRVKEYLVSRRGIDESRITIHSACRSSSSVSLWIVPSGATPPTDDTDNIIDPCPECGATANGSPSPSPSPTPTSEKYTVSGSLRLKAGEQIVLAGAKVVLTKNSVVIAEVTADDQGYFEFKDVPPGMYSLVITGTGFKTTIELTVKDEDALLGTIDISRGERTIRFREHDLIRVGYPDHVLEEPPGEITFTLDRFLGPSEIDPSETHVDGKFEIVDRPPPIPGATPEVPIYRAQGENYSAYATVTLIPNGLTVVSPPSQAELSLAKKPAVWTWKVKPTDSSAEEASFMFHVDIVWRAAGQPDKRFSYDWKRQFKTKLGPPKSVIASTYGSPIFAACSLLTFGVGWKKRKGLLAGPEPADELRPHGATEEVEDEVSTSVYAPGQVLAGNQFLVQVYAHLSAEDPESLAKSAKQADEDAELKGSEQLEKTIKRETPLAFTLLIEDLKVEQQETRVWRGRTIRVQFALNVPSDFEPKDVIAKLMVCEHTVPVGHLFWKFKIVKSATEPSPAPAKVGMAKRYEQAFISYASADRPEVLKRVQAFELVKLPYFVDLLTLEPGDQWEALIYDYINRSDVFFLFWSKAASSSTWVDKEIEHALTRQAGNKLAPPAIIPVILPPRPPVPAKLNHLHFNDKLLCHLTEPKTDEPKAGG